MDNTLQQLQNAETEVEAKQVLNDITVLVHINFRLSHLELAEWTKTHVYYTGVTETNKLAVIEVRVGTNEVYALLDPAQGWVHVGQLIK